MNLKQWMLLITQRKKNDCKIYDDAFVMLTHYVEWRTYANIVVINGLSPVRRHAIIRTNERLLLFGQLATYSNYIWIIIRQSFLRNEMGLKFLSTKWLPFCLGVNVFIIQVYVEAPCNYMLRRQDWLPLAYRHLVIHAMNIIWERQCV